MSTDDYDPLFPTEDEDSIAIHESSSAEVSSKSASNLKVAVSSSRLVEDASILDIDSIPLPGTPAVSELVLNTEDKTLSEQKPLVEDTLSKSPLESDSTPEDDKSNSTRSPLSKIQLLIKQKADQLKNSAGSDTKPKVKNLGLAFSIGKSKSRPTDKVKFSVIKLDKKVSLFDDEEDTVDVSVSPSKLKGSSKLLAAKNDPSHYCDALDSKPSSNFLTDGVLKMVNLSPTKKSCHASSSTSDMSILSNTVRKPSASNLPTHLPSSDLRKTTIASKSEGASQSSIKKSLNQHVENIKKNRLLDEPCNLVNPVTTNSRSASVGDVEELSMQSPKKDFLTNTKNESIVLKPRKICCSTSMQSDASQIRTHVKTSTSGNISNHRRVSFDNIQQANKETDSCNNSVKQSYEADSTIPDESFCNAEIKTLELYSDEDCSLNEEIKSQTDSFHLDTQTHISVLPKSFEPSDAATHHKSLPKDDNDGYAKLQEFSAQELIPTSSTGDLVSHMHNTENKLESGVLHTVDPLEENAQPVKVPQPVLPPDVQSASILPKAPNVSELTAVAQQLFDALSQRIHPPSISNKPTISSHDENNVSSSSGHPLPGGQSKRSHSKSTVDNSKEKKKRLSESSSKYHRSQSRGRERLKRRSRSRNRHCRDRSHSRHRVRSPSKATIRRSNKLSHSPERHQHRRVFSPGDDRRRVKHSLEKMHSSTEKTRSSSEKTHHSSEKVYSKNSPPHSESFTAKESSVSSITSQVIAENLALVSTSETTSIPSSTVLQYVYTADGQICQIASYAPSATTTQVIEGPPPPPPGIGPPPPPRTGLPPPPLRYSSVINAPPPPPRLPVAPPVLSHFDATKSILQFSGNQQIPPNEVLASQALNCQPATYASYLPQAEHVEHMSSRYMSMPPRPHLTASPSTNMPLHQSVSVPLPQSIAVRPHQPASVPPYQSLTVPPGKPVPIVSHQSVQMSAHQSQAVSSHHSGNVALQEPVNVPPHQLVNMPPHQSLNILHQSVPLPPPPPGAIPPLARQPVGLPPRQPPPMPPSRHPMFSAPQNVHVPPATHSQHNLPSNASTQLSSFGNVSFPRQQGPPPPPPGFTSLPPDVKHQCKLPSPDSQSLQQLVSKDARPDNGVAVHTLSQPVIKTEPLISTSADNSPSDSNFLRCQLALPAYSPTTSAEEVQSTVIEKTVSPEDTTEQHGKSSRSTGKSANDYTETGNRRRSSRIQEKETRALAGSKIKADKNAEQAAKSITPQSVDEETVDFVIENRSSKKTIDLPDRTENHQTSPTKPHPGSAPGKLKMRWLQASKCQEGNASMETETDDVVRTTSGEELEREMVTGPTHLDATANQQTPQLVEPAPFDRIDDNIYLTTSKRVSKNQKESKRMVCDCSTSEEDRANGIPACGDDCLNRMLMIECTSRCPCGEFCTNKRFERHLNADVEVVLTDKKGHGLRANKSLPKGTFIREYVGEVLGYKDFKHRVKQYAKDQHRHYYFMALNVDEIIDATGKGNISRFINHSCDPNAETQKWTVNGKLRIGFFTIKDIEENEEITFDYQFERYGKEAQICYCGSSNCRGVIGGEKPQALKPITDSKPQPGGKKKKEDNKRKLDYSFSDDTLSTEIEKLTSLGGLKRSEHVLQLSRLMVRADNVEQRVHLADIILETTNHSCLRLFLSYHGLSVLWSWLVDLPNIGCYELKIMIINVLRRLPINNRNVIQETKIQLVLERLLKDSKERLDILSAEAALKQEKADTLSAEAVLKQEKAGTLSTEAVLKQEKTYTDVANQPIKFKASPEVADSVFNQEVLDTSLEMAGADNCQQVVTGSGSLDKQTKEDCSHESKEMLKKDTALDSGTDATVSASPTSVSNTAQPVELIAERQSQTGETDDLALPRSRPQLHRQSSDQLTDEVDVKSSADGDSQDGCQSQDEHGSDTGTKTEEEGNELNELDDLTHMVSLIEEVLEAWSELKEEFKIPKKQENEERKRTVYEIDTSKHDEYDQRKDRRESSSYGGKYKRRKKYNGKACAHQETEQMLLSKLERRRMFEEQVRAEELYEFQQQQYAESQKSSDAYCDDFSQPPPMPEQSFPNATQPAVAPQHSHPHQYVGQDIPHPTPTVETPQFSALPTEPAQFPAQSGENSQYPVQPVESQYSVQPVGFIQPTPTSIQPVATPVLTQSSVALGSQAPALCYYTTPQGMLFQQIVQATPQQSNPSVIYMTPASQTIRIDEPPPPPAERKSSLPSDWRSATDAQGRIYYYHKVTRQTQWEVPTGDEELGAAMELESPSQEKKSKAKHRKTTMAPADTSADAKKMKEHFKSAISVHIRTLLNGYMKTDCKVGKITNKEDYKFLAKKLTHAVLDKELKHCRHLEDLEVNENVKFKAKEFVKKYMARSGGVYKRDKEDK